MRFFERNIDRRGRLARAALGVLLLACGAGALRAGLPGWVGLALAGGGLFALIESAAGWCAARACGIRTKL